jgi:hypothetical protein
LLTRKGEESRKVGPQRDIGAFVEDFDAGRRGGEEGLRCGGERDVGDYNIAALREEELREGEIDAGAGASDLVGY